MRNAESSTVDAHDDQQQVPKVWRRIETPLGDLLLVGREEGVLEQIGLPKGKLRVEPEPHWQRRDDVFEHAVAQLNEYFAGHRKSFELDLAPRGTPFQLEVWQHLREIPYGETISYAELARRVGNPRASRAVGAANGKNPLPIVVPCHRVVGADGSLVGFGGGLSTKRQLLALEGVGGAQGNLLSAAQ